MQSVCAWVVCGALWLAPAMICAGDRPPADPERIEVSVDEVPFFSGPTSDDYACGYLHRGDMIEVYRRTRSGWLAIRPPQGSFSWVPVEDMAVDASSATAMVASSEVIAWIGSALGTPAQYRWQVRLAKGERVALLAGDRESRAPLADAPAWYKVAPPSGEFRWVRGRDLGISPPPLPRRNDRGVQQASWESPAAPVAGSTAAERSAPDVLPPDSRHAIGGTRNELVAWKALLAAELAKPVDQWQLRDLDRQIRSLQESGSADIRREAAQLRLALDELRKLQRRHQLLDSRVALVAYEEANGEGRGESAVEFDGSGYLMPVHSTREQVPPFALLNDENKIVFLVRPAPGLRLHRYANQRVGIYGRRQDIGGRPPLLTAERVVVLR